MGDFNVGEVLAGKYEIKAILGQGGMGMVYRARQIDLGRDVAIKVPHPQALELPGFLARFSREARLVAKLVHDNIVQVYEYVEQAPLVYIVMEYVEGQDLKSLVAKPPADLTVRDVATMMRLSLEGLGHAHEAGIVHRDIKPHNIMVQQRARGKWRVKIMDFGIAHLDANTNLTMHQEQLTVTGQAIGTPSYMSPEQIRGTGVVPSSDIYSFGCVIYYMFTRQTPFSGTGFTVAAAHLSEAPPLLRDRIPALPEELEAIVQRCLEKDPSLRPQDASDLGQEVFDALTPIFDMPMADIWPRYHEEYHRPTDVPNPTEAGTASAGSAPSHATVVDDGGGLTEGTESRDAMPPTRNLRDSERIPAMKGAPAPAPAKPAARPGAPARPAEKTIATGTQTAPSQLSKATIPYGPGGVSDTADTAAGTPTTEQTSQPAPSKNLLYVAVGAIGLLVLVAGVGAILVKNKLSASGDNKGTVVVNNNGNGSRVDNPVVTPTVPLGTPSGPEAQPSPVATSDQPDVRPTPEPAIQTPVPTRATQSPEPSPSIDPVQARVAALRSQFESARTLNDKAVLWADASRDIGRAAAFGELAQEMAVAIASNPEMVAVDGGRYSMGAPDSFADASAEERPQHNVRLSPYEIGRYEVTALEFAAFLNTQSTAGELYRLRPKANVVKDGERYVPATGRALHPVNFVSFDAATAYADWLSAQTGKRFRLPTEAEWEVAARGGTEFLYPGSNEAPNSQTANFNRSGTVEVLDLIQSTNRLGLRHMAGNVAEWCLDWYSEDAYRGGGTRENPRGPNQPTEGARKVNRGGSFATTRGEDLRVTRRDRSNPTNATEDIGFRLVRDP